MSNLGRARTVRYAMARARVIREAVLGRQWGSQSIKAVTCGFPARQGGRTPPNTCSLSPRPESEEISSGQVTLREIAGPDLCPCATDPNAACVLETDQAP